MDDCDLERLLEPVREHLDDAVEELTAGRKRTHWMWFVFPQLRALGRSDMARRYGLADLDEARRFVVHAELGPTYERLVAIVHDVVVRQDLLVHDSPFARFSSSQRTPGGDLMDQCSSARHPMSATGIPTYWPGHGLALGIEFQLKAVLTGPRLGTSLSLQPVGSH